MTEQQLKQKLHELKSLPSENEVLEFKEAKNNFDFKRLGKYFSALCNEANLKAKSEAWLVFGIKDSDKSVVGTNYRTNRSKLNSLKAEIANKTTNRITFLEIFELFLPEGRIIMFQIPPAPKGFPIAWDGHYYGRDGEYLSPLNIEEIERIRSQATNKDWSAGLCDEATINDLAPEAINKARENYKTKFPHLAKEIENWDNITFLNKTKITINGQITHTAIILLGKPESEHFISPAQSKITWILKDRDNIELDYTHFSPPLLLEVDKLYKKIRNLKYRYIKDGTLFPDEVEMYEPFVIREALHNCIAHQDYNMGGRINVVEFPDRLIFTNAGPFLPGSVEDVIRRNTPEERNLNPFLIGAMFNLNMIDTIGSGIKRMFNYQRKRFFPLPEYDLTYDRVKVIITGKVLDMDYARTLARHPDLVLEDIILLDKIQKKKTLNQHEIKHLKSKRLIEGRKPNFYISAKIAQKTDQKSDYIKSRGIDNDYCKKIILEYLQKFKKGKRSDFEDILLDKLPDVLTDTQKKDKVKNNLQSLRKEGHIKSTNGKLWILNKNSF